MHQETKWFDFGFIFSAVETKENISFRKLDGLFIKTFAADESVQVFLIIFNSVFAPQETNTRYAVLFVVNCCAGESSLGNLEVIADEGIASSTSHVGTDDLDLFHFEDVHTHAETVEFEVRLF